jgi:hypothetical protein
MTTRVREAHGDAWQTLAVASETLPGVPHGVPWPHGRHLFTKRLMGLTPDAFMADGPPPRPSAQQFRPG